MDSAQLGHSLLYTYAILQACDCPKKSAALICAWSNRHRQDGPEFGRTACARTLFDVKLKIRRHHADHCELLTIECYRLANHTRLTTEPTLPQCVTEHSDWRLICLIVVR